MNLEINQGISAEYVTLGDLYHWETDILGNFRIKENKIGVLI